MIPLNNDDFESELNIIKHIAMANGYECQMIDNILKKHKARRSRQTQDNIPNNKFISTYTELMPKILTSTLSKIGYTVTFKTNNRLRNLVHPVVETNIESKTGVYKLMCDDCDRFYISQTAVSYTHLDVYKRQTTRGAPCRLLVRW